MDKKELINEYKNRTQIGGIFAIKNTRLNKWYVDYAADLTSAKNRFDFMATSYMKIEKDYTEQKGEGFVFETLEELKKSESQTDKEFKDDLDMLRSIWLEKLLGQDLY